MTKVWFGLHAILLAGGLMLAAGAGSAADAEELRIGFLASITGPSAAVGKDMVDGFQMYLDQANHRFGGADVKLVIEDEQAKPDVGVTKARKVILQDHVQMFIGGILASTGYALAPVSSAEKTVYIASIPAADDLTQRQLDKYPYFVRTGSLISRQMPTPSSL